MKKILLIIAVVFCIFQMVVLATAIDIGSPAIDRTDNLSYNDTIILKDNPANATGMITSIEIWAYTDFSNLKVATFYSTGTNEFSTRDTETIGSVTAGAKRTFEVNLDVQTGDYVGFYATSGYIERDLTGGIGYWYYEADKIPCTETVFTVSDNTTAILSLYGIGVTPPNPPTNVQASDGTYNNFVTIILTKSAGATGYQVYRDGVGLGWLGDIDYYNDTGADAPTITPGTASASDGVYIEHVALSLSEQSANNGTTHTYKVRARIDGAESDDSETDTGYRGVGTLTYQRQRSSGDGDADYSDIDGATTDPYNDTGAPENGDGRYYKCVENATGATQQISANDRGNRDVVPTYNFFGYNLNP